MLIKILLLLQAMILLISCQQNQEKAKITALEEISYQQPYRPQFHFSPPQNWINDPNGLTYHNGEYHLFYQYNPYGDVWGHMSWGHAVSKDLVHWDHLPVALKEENNVMIFSGSAVSDVDNTSGFGTKENPPMVAIYTGHHTDKKLQDQRIAYSTDNGRTWTKFKGNPVLDIDKAEFRDPKVIWHEPTQKWVVVVAAAIERKVHFYGSKNLKEWEFLSDFGPAASNERNWECPDLFRLPVEGTDGKFRWVLQVDVGDGAVAGGSGGQYFVGHFDGTAFTSEVPEEDTTAEPLWVDYGKDFYAVQSWSNIPKNDGRRLWLAWMNNWQYAGDIPTNPWRGSMTIPREVTLVHLPDGIRLIQKPIAELDKIRGQSTNINSMSISSGAKNLSKKGIEGKKLEILATFELRGADEFGFKVHKGESEETVVGYRVDDQELFVDRTNSGAVAFSEDFPGVHTAPMKPEQGTITLHLFIDHSSVEVFGNQGRRVITDRIFPSKQSDEIDLYAKNGDVTLTSLTSWELRSVWR